jgi:hypothetical protein
LARGTFALGRGIEMPVDGGAGHAEEIRDLLDRALAGIVKLLRENGLLRVESWSPPTLAAT